MSPIGTLNAIQLATALIWRERVEALPEMLTHDAALGAAAHAFGFDVRGTESSEGKLPLRPPAQSSCGNRPRQPASP